MTLGVTLVDMGGATTGFAIFHDGHLVTSDIIPIGGSTSPTTLRAGFPPPLPMPSA